jgi:hypothetical protein
MSGWFPPNGGDGPTRASALYCQLPYFIVGFEGDYMPLLGADTTGFRQFTSMHARAIPSLYHQVVDKMDCCDGAKDLPNSPEDLACKAFDAVPGSASCHVISTGFCAANLPDPRCLTYCNSNDCTAVGQSYALSLGDKAHLSGEAACFMPQSYYQNYFASLRKQVNGLPDNIPDFPECFYPMCATSKYKSFRQPTCPSVLNCIQNVEVAPSGTINGNVTINQSNQCKLTAAGAGGSASSASCNSVSCGPHGTCASGKCICADGYSGDKCNVIIPVNGGSSIDPDRVPPAPPKPAPPVPVAPHDADIAPHTSLKTWFADEYKTVEDWYNAKPADQQRYVVIFIFMIIIVLLFGGYKLFSAQREQSASARQPQWAVTGPLGVAQ